MLILPSLPPFVNLSETSAPLFVALLCIEGTHCCNRVFQGSEGLEQVRVPRAKASIHFVVELMYFDR